MKAQIYILLACAGFLITSCIKNNPYKETFKADGSWKIEKVNITEYDSTGSVSNTIALNDVGFMMLIHEDELYYEGSFSFKVNSQEFMDTSSMFDLFYNAINPANTWQVSNYAKAFHLSYVGDAVFNDIATFTIAELKRKKFEMFHVETYPSGMLKRTEEWKMVRATH